MQAALRLVSQSYSFLEIQIAAKSLNVRKQCAIRYFRITSTYPQLFVENGCFLYMQMLLLLIFLVDLFKNCSLYLRLFGRLAGQDLYRNLYYIYERLV